MIGAKLVLDQIKSEFSLNWGYCALFTLWEDTTHQEKKTIMLWKTEDNKKKTNFEWIEPQPSVGKILAKLLMI